MTREELQAIEWMVAKGIDRQDIKKNVSSPDFSTPAGDYEVKKVDAKGCIHFTYSQLLDKVNFTTLVFDGDAFLVEIPKKVIQERQSRFGTPLGYLSIYYEDFSPVLSVRISSAVSKQLKRISAETGRDISDLVREAIMALIGMYNNAGTKRTDQ